jgi:multicomponent Na+:H+ antiporter subunit D
VAPTPVCILLAGAFSELGLYGLARVWWTVFEPALGVHAAGLRAILVAAGVLTGVVGAVMCGGQHHLKRMLAFATIAQVGLFLVGIGLLSADGLAGTAVWVVADGLVKASLFACVAIVQHRYGTIEERDLHGRARELWPVGTVFVLGALLIASLPVTGSFLGKALVEDAALAEPGYGWVPVVLLAVTGVVGGTLLRAAARVFWGIGSPAPAEVGEGEDEERPERESEERPRHVSPALWMPAVGMLAAAVAWGLLPGLVDAAGRAAAAFADSGGYARQVLAGVASVPAAPPELHGPGATAYLYAVGSVAMALGVATAALALPRTLPAPAARALDGLRGLHNGRPGDYVAWAVAGTAVLGGLFAVVLV